MSLSLEKVKYTQFCVGFLENLHSALFFRAGRLHFDFENYVQTTLDNYFKSFYF